MSAKRKLSVLLVEDNPHHAYFTIKSLAASKAVDHLDHVEDGEEAVSYLSQKSQKYPEAMRPDLILLDINMPRMNGHEFLEIVKEDEKFKHIPVVVFSSSNALTDRFKAFHNHSNSYVVKSNALQEFETDLNEVVTYWSRQDAGYINA